MALKVTGADYPNRAHLQQLDPTGRLQQLMDEVVNRIHILSGQVKGNPLGNVLAPNAPSALSVTVTGQIATVSIADNNAAPLTEYLLEYATTSNFQSLVEFDLGIAKSWSGNLHLLTVYFRAVSRFPTSGKSGYVYYGTPSNPTAVVIP